MIVVEKTIEREFIKQCRASFIAIRKARDKLHHNFKEGMTIHLDGYRGVNLSETRNA
jgi:hypothetical protein